MDFRSYGGDIDWGFVAFAGFSSIAFLLLFGGIFLAYQQDQITLNEKRIFKASCIDAGGYPVSPFDYVKGHGEGYLCINPSAIIDLK